MIPVLAQACATAIAPRKHLSVSEWADTYRYLSTKQSPRPGRWRTDNNPLLREPMDCIGPRHPAREIVIKFPIQIGKSEIETNGLGSAMHQAPGPIMMCLPGEVSMNKWISQKLNPMLEETPVLQDLLTSTASRNAANQKDFKDFAGGLLYIEHAGSPARLKSSTVRYLFVDELTEFANNLRDGSDPLTMLDGRTSAFTGREKRVYVSTPGVAGACRITEKWDKSDQRHYHVPCPHCQELQPLEWDGLVWPANATAETVDRCWYVCRECGAMIEEHHKTWMLRDEKAGGLARWIPTYPEREIRGYTANCLYYQIGLGPRWLDLVRLWLESQGDPAKLQTFKNDRLAEAWEERSHRTVRANLIQERAEPLPLGVVPHGYVWLTAGVDTQDDRLEMQIVAWGPRRIAVPIMYAVFQGDPNHDEVWINLADTINRGVRHASGIVLPISATAIDGRGHRTQAVKDFCRRALIRRPMCIFGAKSAAAPALSRPKFEDTTHKGRVDSADNALRSWNVGTVRIKHEIYNRLAADAEAMMHEQQGRGGAPVRYFRFPDALPDTYFAGLVSEVFDPAKGRYVHRRGAGRNEPLDTLVYAWAATLHPELQLEKKTIAQWASDEARLLASVATSTPASPDTSPTPVPATHRRPASAPTMQPDENDIQPRATHPAAPQPRSPVTTNLPRAATPRRRVTRSSYLSR